MNCLVNLSLNRVLILSLWFFFTLQESTVSLPHGTSHSKPPSGPTCAVALSQTVRRAEGSSLPTSCRKTSLSSLTTREKVQKEITLSYPAADNNKQCCLLRCCIYVIYIYLFISPSLFIKLLSPLSLIYRLHLSPCFSQVRALFPLRPVRISQSSRWALPCMVSARTMAND